MTLAPCLICSRQTGHPDKLCPMCLPWVEYVRGAQPLSAHEQAALDFAIEQAGKHVDTNGPDLSAWDEVQVRGFTREIIQAFGAGLRAEIARNEVPF